jgi:hypothetical protein
VAVVAGFDVMRQRANRDRVLASVSVSTTVTTLSVSAVM